MASILSSHVNRIRAIFRPTAALTIKLPSAEELRHAHYLYWHGEGPDIQDRIGLYGPWENLPESVQREWVDRFITDLFTSSGVADDLHWHNQLMKRAWAHWWLLNNPRSQVMQTEVHNYPPQVSYHAGQEDPDPGDFVVTIMALPPGAPEEVEPLSNDMMVDEYVDWLDKIWSGPLTGRTGWASVVDQSLHEVLMDVILLGSPIPYPGEWRVGVEGGVSTTILNRF